MKIFIATDVTFFRQGDKIFANGKHAIILRRYYQSFGSIVLYARFVQIDYTEKGFDDITDIIDSTCKIYSLRRIMMGMDNCRISAAMRNCDMVICRCPSVSAYRASSIAKRLNIPYLAEAMGDAWNAYWNHGPKGKIIAAHMHLKMKKVLKNANYALYVTNQYLQKRYPCKKPSIAVSNVLIKSIDEEILARRIQKLKQFNSSEIKLMTTAAVDVLYKGQQYVIRAIPFLNQIGIKIKYVIVGEGDISYLDGEAKRFGVEEQVEFKGRIPLDEVFKLLDEADIYIQPSLQEGLPRSVIEAMSRGCACIGAKTAGIPELIDASFVIRRKSVSDIVDSIFRYTNLSYEHKIEIAKRNFEESKKYEANLLDTCRNRYFSRIVRDII